MTRFRIEYRDPETNELKEVEKECEDSTDPHLITAREWAEDHAYMLADKGWYRITEIK